MDKLSTGRMGTNLLAGQLSCAKLIVQNIALGILVDHAKLSIQRCAQVVLVLTRYPVPDLALKMAAAGMNISCETQEYLQCQISDQRCWWKFPYSTFCHLNCLCLYCRSVLKMINPYCFFSLSLYGVLLLKSGGCKAMSSGYVCSRLSVVCMCVCVCSCP